MRYQLPILLPEFLQIKAKSGVYTLLMGQHDTRGDWDNCWNDSYDVMLDGICVAKLFDSPSYPGKLQVSINGIRWLGDFPTDYHDHTFHDYLLQGDFIGPGDFAKTFTLTVERCEKINALRGGWKPKWGVDWYDKGAPFMVGTCMARMSFDTAVKAVSIFSKQRIDRTYRVYFARAYA
jgi:hypothetical protein